MKNILKSHITQTFRNKGKGNVLRDIASASALCIAVFFITYKYIVEYRLLALFISIVVYIFSLYILYLYEKSVIKKNILKE